ncbi:histone deacetylase [Streptomyces profundus]|uniref:histone deacetylase n=1 Tax=Streptomyces profundus TaxID=2867410 RepID=UPI001D16D006|nr:histone deacetylase [Streptomyces sp. MA3_2.13]UED88507.1 histone deacetylase [Streptomyces sp. MA3_2.13]
MSVERLGHYLRGGSPPGGGVAHPGCRDPSPPPRTRPVMLPGVLYFATESAVWSGGRAFLDPDAPGRAPAVAHLLTVGQFSDVAAQEMGRAPGRDLDLPALLGASGRAALGPGRYETLVLAGEHEGVPMVTFTAPWRLDAVAGNAPAAAYLRMLGSGLMAGHGWSAVSTAGYLAARPGAAGRWTAEAVRRLLTRREA